MSIRSTAFFAGGGPTTILFQTAALEISKPSFDVNKLHLVFQTANIDITGVQFSVERGAINYDNGFMAF